MKFADLNMRTNNAAELLFISILSANFVLCVSVREFLFKFWAKKNSRMKIFYDELRFFPAVVKNSGLEIVWYAWIETQRKFGRKVIMHFWSRNYKCKA